MKRRYGDRSNWQRIIKRRYAQCFLDKEEYRGYMTLIDMVEVREALSVSYENQDVCIVENGYMWLQQFPEGKNYAITTTFDEHGQIVQWYIDIILQSGVENGVPWFDDLYLDIVVLPSGEVFVLDEDELDKALAEDEIDKETYYLAWGECNRLVEEIEEGTFGVLDLAREHRDILLGKLEASGDIERLE